MSLTRTAAILLRSYPYSETSQILRFFTEDLGVAGVVARGVRATGGRRGGSPTTFSQGILSLYYREGRDLQTFHEFLPSDPRLGLSRHPVRLAAASVMGELVMRHSESDRNPALFNALSRGLSAVEGHALDSIIKGLLEQLWPLVVQLGYRPLLEHCVECGRALHQEEIARLDFGAGGLCCAGCRPESQGPRLGPRARIQLSALLAGHLEDDLVRPRAHLRLASDFITYHISGGEPLRSMSILSALIPTSHA